MAGATADDLEALIYRYYTDLGAVEFVVDGTDVEAEVRLPAEHAAALLTHDQ
jgi:hypothetical protein